MFFAGIMNICLTILYLSPKGLEKTYIDFSNNTFPLDRSIILTSLYMGNLIYSRKYLTSMTVLKYDNVIKKSRDLDNYFVIFLKILRGAKG